jgi:hypothetical protein
MGVVADRGNATCAGGRNAGRALGLYQRRRPAETVLYQLVQEHLETFLALTDDGAGGGLARVRGTGFSQIPWLRNAGPRVG